MRYYKGMPTGLWIIAISVIIFTFYYHIQPFIWGADTSIYAPIFTLSLWGLFIWINIILEAIGIYAVTYGFYRSKNWARLFTIAMFVFSSFWNLYFLLIVRVWPHERYIWQWYYTIVIVYLLMSDVKDYFVIGK